MSDNIVFEARSSVDPSIVLYRFVREHKQWKVGEKVRDDRGNICTVMRIEVRTKDCGITPGAVVLTVHDDKYYEDSISGWYIMHEEAFTPIG